MHTLCVVMLFLSLERHKMSFITTESRVTREKTCICPPAPRDIRDTLIVIRDVHALFNWHFEALALPCAYDNSTVEALCTYVFITIL